MCEKSSSTPPREEWDYSENNLPDGQVELCYRHEYRRECYLAQGVEDDSVIPFLRLHREAMTGLRIASLHPNSQREIFLRADPGSDNPFSENPCFTSGSVVRGDVPAMRWLIDHSFSEERKGMVLNYLESGGNERAFFSLGIDPAERDAGLVALLYLNTRDYGREALMKGFADLLDRFEGEMGSGRGPTLSRFRAGLNNLAIVRIRHWLSLRESTRFLRNCYLADQFRDNKEGGNSLEKALDDNSSRETQNENLVKVGERIRERRRLVLECFREENPEAGADVEPACFEEAGVT